MVGRRDVQKEATTSSARSIGNREAARAPMIC